MNVYIDRSLTLFTSCLVAVVISQSFISCHFSCSPPPPPKRRSRRQASNKTDPALIIGNVEDSNTRVTRRSMRNSQKK